MVNNMATTAEKSEYEEDFVPKTAKRKISKAALIAAAVVAVIAGLCVGGYFLYEGTYYYKTDNAKVDTDVYQLTANASGKLVKMSAYEGEGVKAGQVLARVDNGPYVRSPIDGTVTDVKMQKDDYVSASDVVLVVADTSDMYVTANVEETDILKLRAGQSATVSLDAYGKSYPGYVDEVNTVTSTKLTGAATSFTTTGTYTKVTQLLPVRIRLLGDADLADVIGTNATIKVRIK